MPAIIRQQYIDPNTNVHHVREMQIDIEIVRPESLTNASSELFLKVEPWGGPNPHAAINMGHFEKVFLDPEELIVSAIDGKRTTTPLNCQRSRLSTVCPNGSFEFCVFDNTKNGLNAHPGDVLVLLSDLDGNQTYNALVEEVNGNRIKISKGVNTTFYVGAFVQNLSNCWNKKTKIGAKSQLKRPQPVTFWVTSQVDCIEIMIQTPITPGSIKYYDVYVRNEAFEDIEPHWMPDVSDILADEEEVNIKTYNGGEQCGGANLVSPGIYYVGLVSKDKSGRTDVNESMPYVQRVELLSQ